MKVHIKWLDDTHECETCGFSYAEGAKVFIDGKLIIDKVPISNCCNPLYWNEEEILREILHHISEFSEERD